MGKSKTDRYKDRKDERRRSLKFLEDEREDSSEFEKPFKGFEKANKKDK